MASLSRLPTWIPLIATISCGLWFLPAHSLHAEDAAVSLRYKFEPGQFLYYEVENVMQIVTQFDGASEDVTNTSQAWKQLRVVSVDEAGNALLEPMVERVRMTALRDGEEAGSYDSADPDAPPPQFRQVKETIGNVVARIKVSPNGELLQAIPVAQNNPALLEAAKKNDPRLNFLVVLPKTPVKVNESWKDTFSSDVMVDKGLKQDVKIQRTYTLTAVKGSVAVIKLKTSVLTPVEDPQIKVQLMQRTPNGVIEFDFDQGRIISMQTQIDEIVHGPFGPKSSMSTKTKSNEKLLPGRPEFKTVSRTEKVVK